MQKDTNLVNLHKYNDHMHGTKSDFSSEEEIWRTQGTRGLSESSNISYDEETYQSDSESYLSSDTSQHHQPLFSPPPPPPHFKQKESGLAKKKRREIEDDEDLRQQISSHSFLPHLLNEIKTQALRNSAERVDAIAAIEANRRSNARQRVSHQSGLMDQIKALKPNSGARLAAIQDAEVHRTGEQEAKRKELLDSFARRFVILPLFHVFSLC